MNSFVLSGRFRRNGATPSHSHCLPLFFLLLTCFLLARSSVASAQGSLAWDDPNLSQNVGGYSLYYWQSGQTPTKRNIGLANPYALSNLPLVAGQTYNFAVAAYDTNGSNESALSNVVTKTMPVNQAPVAQNLTIATPEDQPVQGTLLATDTEGSSVTYQLVSNGTKGTAVLTNANTGAFTYTPNANNNGPDAFTFRASDGLTYSNTATVTVTIAPVNDTPVASYDSATTSEDAVITVAVLGNDSDVDGDALSLTAVTPGSKGQTTITSSSVRYTPNANLTGSDTFTYTISDGKGGTATGTVAVTITPVNDAPVAVNDSVTTTEDTAVTVAVLGNDSDIDGDALSLTAVTPGSKGQTTITSSSVRYTPTANLTGSDTFTYTISDGKGGTATGTVTVTITPVNDAPIAQNGTLNAQAGVESSGTLSASDSDGNTLTYHIVSNGTKGIVKLLNTATGAYTYTPAASATGTDTFTFKANDGTIDSNLATVAVTIQTAQQKIFEVGEVEVNHTWKRVTFSQPFTTPVVVAKPASYRDTAPAVVRIRNVDTQGFEVRMQEWDYLDGTHALETVSYLVMEQGWHTLAGSIQVEARTVQLNRPTQFTAMTFSQSFSTVPVVLTSVVSVNDSRAVTTRVRNVTSQKFETLLQGQEANTAHASETLAYIAWQPSTGTLADGLAFEVGKTTKVMTHQFQTIRFAQGFPALPMFLADLQTTSGGDTATLRWDKRSTANIDVKVEEEQSKDSETTHAKEVVGYLAFVHPDSALRLVAIADTDSDGLMDEEENGVYGTDPLTADTDEDGMLDGEEVTYWGTTWNQDTDNDGLSNLLDSDADNDGVSDGVEVRADTDPADPVSRPQIFEAGDVEVDHTWKRVTFRQPFVTPVVVAKPASYRGSDPTVVRIRNVDSEGFEVRLQEWEYLDGTHVLETVSYLVMEQGRHTLAGSVQVEAGTRVLNNPAQFTAATFSLPFGTAPVVLTSVVSVNDSKAVTTRIQNVNLQQFEVLLQGQEANPAHVPETVAYIAWEPSTGTLADGLAFEVNTTSMVMDHQFRPIEFVEPFQAIPVFLADIQTTKGADTAALRWDNRDEIGIDVKVEEEQSKDSEIEHIQENVGYIVIVNP